MILCVVIGGDSKLQNKGMSWRELIVPLPLSPFGEKITLNLRLQQKTCCTFPDDRYINKYNKYHPESRCTGILMRLHSRPFTTGLSNQVRRKEWKRRKQMRAAGKQETDLPKKLVQQEQDD